MQPILYIADIQRNTVIADGTDQLEATLVVFNLKDQSELAAAVKQYEKGNETSVIHKSTQGYPVEYTKEQVIAEIRKFFETFKQERAAAETNTKRDEVDAQVTETITGLKGGFI